MPLFPMDNGRFINPNLLAQLFYLPLPFQPR